MKKIRSFLLRQPELCVVILSLLLGYGMCLISIISNMLRGGEGNVIQLIYVGFLISLFVACPIILTLYNIVYLIIPSHQAEISKKGRVLEYFTIVFGVFCSFLWARLTDIQWGMDWMVQLYNNELHTPIATWTWTTVITLGLVGVICYVILRFSNINRMPPLVGTIAIGGVYIGAALCVIWIIQIIGEEQVLCLYPFNLVVIAAKTIKDVVFDWNSYPHELPQGKGSFISQIHRLLYNSGNWCWIGVLCALPLLGILIALLTLFGQAPDSIIQAWVETSDWTFSQQVAPQNIHMDQHYLCTVAAGGHRKIVKPIRVGKRHGHRVLVNRQLCVANAFEQLLEERIPRVHRIIRRFYDRFGYPIAKHIRSPYAADVIWFLMKPLEWFFLAVLYLFDTNPENRIAVQYPHAPLPKK